MLSEEQISNIADQFYCLSEQSDSGIWFDKVGFARAIEQEIITMFEAAQKDSLMLQYIVGSEKYAVCKWNPFSESWSACVHTSEIDAAMHKELS